MVRFLHRPVLLSIRGSSGTLHERHQEKFCDDGRTINAPPQLTARIRQGRELAPLDVVRWLVVSRHASSAPPPTAVSSAAPYAIARAAQSNYDGETEKKNHFFNRKIQYNMHALHSA